MRKFGLLLVCVLLIFTGLVAKKKKAEPVMLEHLSWKPFWTTHMGCIKGCLDYLEMDVSDAWLYGASGHAFVINIHEQLCPSGPTAWVTEKMIDLAKNVGYTFEGITAYMSDTNSAEVQKQAWDMVRTAIDEGYPCYGWELNIPEYFVITGYDDVGYYYSGTIMENYKMPMPWDDLAETEIGWLEVYVVKPGEAKDDRTTVKEALEFALEIAESPEKWIFEGYSAGPEAFDLWIAALENDTIFKIEEAAHGFKYNTMVWLECRSEATWFLEEAKDRLNDSELDPLFDEAITHYRQVTRSLKKVEELFPWYTSKPSFFTDEARLEKTIEALRVARDAEAGGLKSLEKIVSKL